MKAINRMVETILPEFLKFIEDQESLKNGNKQLDFVANTSVTGDKGKKGVYNANGN